MTLRMAFAEDFIAALRKVATNADLNLLMQAAARELGCRYWALVHHDDLRANSGTCINLKEYPAAIVHRLIDERGYRRDPVMRACLHAGSAFVWSEMTDFIALDRRDQGRLAQGAREGLNEGITVPCAHLGECMGSCTFSGMRRPDRARHVVGHVQVIGVFAFQAARRVLGIDRIRPLTSPRLHPRPRDCVALAGQGCSNKEIARALSLTPRTVDGYLTEARRIFGVHGRTELVVSAVLAGEIGLHELQLRQPG